MNERFPDVEWYCDRCGAYLNSQDGFDDHHYIWKCKECGFKNSISSSNIFESHEAFKNYMRDDDE
jgi:ribosomal protein L37AE/L43A